MAPRGSTTDDRDRLRGPIRRRIKALTVKLQPFDQSLTDQEAKYVRNTIESMLQTYFFEVQPWAVQRDSGGSNDFGRVGGGLLDGEPPHRTSGNAPEGSVTHVGLAQEVENRPLQEGVVEVIMNGLVYFAEGSQNIPNENELLQTMKTKALGDSQAVVEALQAYFPAQQELVVTVETATAIKNDNTNVSNVDSDSNVVDDATNDAGPNDKNSSGSNDTSDVDAAANAPISGSKSDTALNPWRDDLTLQEPDSSGQIVAAATSDQSPLDGSSSSPLNSSSSMNMAALGGGIAVAAVALIAIVGLFVVRRKKVKSSKVTDVTSVTSSREEYLMDVKPDLEQGFGDDWKVNSFDKNDKNNNNTDNNTNDATTPAPGTLPSTDPNKEALPQKHSPIQASSKIAPMAPGESQEPKENAAEEPSNNSSRMSYISSLFQRKNNAGIEQHLEVSSASDNDHPQKGGLNTYNSMMSDCNFTDDDCDGLSDFDDVVSIQPHVVTLQSLESFEKQHTTMVHQQFVQKDQLRSPFEEETPLFKKDQLLSPFAAIPNINATSLTSTALTSGAMTNPITGGSTTSDGDNLSYSSSSISFRESPPPRNTTFSPDGIPDELDRLVQQQSLEAAAIEQDSEDEQEDQRIRYSMMPNPYFQNHMNHKIKRDKSAPCVLQPTEITASTLARRRSPKQRDINIVETGSNTGSTHSSSSMDMVPKLTALLRKRSPSASKAVVNAFKEDDLAYSGDEENTFGVASSDGWDPDDTVLSSTGDPLSLEEMRMVEFHTLGDNAIRDPEERSPIRSKRSPSKQMETAKSVLQKVKMSPDRTNIENAKSLLQKVKQSSEIMNDTSSEHQLGQSIISIQRDDILEEIKFDTPSMEI